MSKEYKTVPAEFLTFLKDAPVGSGICMCGDKMEDHSPHGYHSPVEMWDHNLNSWLDEIKSLNSFGTLESQALATVSQHRDRYAELLNQLVDAAGIKKPDDTSEQLTGPDLVTCVEEAVERITALRNIAQKISEKLDHPTLCVTSIDADALRMALRLDDES